MDNGERLSLKTKKPTRKQLMKHQVEKFTWTDGSVEPIKDRKSFEEQCKQKGIPVVWY